jgi:hypothetical protein
MKSLQRPLIDEKADQLLSMLTVELCLSAAHYHPRYRIPALRPGLVTQSKCRILSALRRS